MQSASQPLEKNLTNVQKEGGAGQRRFDDVKKNCRISKEVHSQSYEIVLYDCDNCATTMGE